MTEQESPNLGYKPPAIAIRSTRIIGDFTDEMVIEFDELPVTDGPEKLAALIVNLVNACACERPGATTNVNVNLRDDGQMESLATELHTIATSQGFTLTHPDSRTSTSVEVLRTQPDDMEDPS